MANLVIVSNRLPVSVKRVDGKLEFYPSVGGLATGLSSYASKGKSKWIGWPGLPSDDLTASEKRQIARELRKHHCYPIHLTQKQLDDYYNGYSNSVLWPLFHNLEVKTGDTPKNWKAYKEVNALFAEETLLLTEPGSVIWVHDYQLLLLPELLRQERPGDNIGFFLHIPFPTPEVLGTIGHTSRLLQGMLGADLVGFHTNSYTENFLACCQAKGLGIVEPKRLILPDRVVRVTEFPIGIDYAKFTAATKQRAVRAEYRKLAWKYRNKKVIVTVDRLDPTKGLDGRLVAYKKFLKANPKLHGKVVMVMLAVPSRADIEEYKALRVKVEGLVADINSSFGTSRWNPVEYLYESWPFPRLAALYQRADIAFIAPIRDGMNLVAKEYLASRPKHDGVLILSETAGAAEELKEAVMVNPSKPKTLVDGLTQAITMPRQELRRRTRTMQKHIEEFTIQKWADNFIESLQAPLIPTTSRVKGLNQNRIREIVASYHQARKRVILLDYDGVLKNFNKDPNAAKPSPRILKLLERLGSNPANEVVVISGRSKADLGAWFGELPLALAAEHGALFRRKNGRAWHKTTTHDNKWKKSVADIFEYYANLTPGAFVEHKEWSLVWHYRAASPYYSQKHLVILKRLLRPIVKANNLSIKDGNKVLEVHPSDISKGRIAQEWLIHDHDFVLCVGDDATDEEMFAVMPPEAYSIKVGRGLTLARMRTKTVRDVLDLLGKL